MLCCKGGNYIKCPIHMAAIEQECTECGRTPCACDDGAPQDEEEREESPVSPLKRSYAYIGGQPRDPDADDVVEPIDEDEEVLDHAKDYHKKFKQALLCSESYSHDPDLEVYFDDFHLSAQQRIAICRTYANYLTQKLRASGKMAPARVHKNTTKH